MKKKWLLAVLSVLVLSATGCVEVIELDEEQADKFVQYSVYSVLQHDKNYLVKLENADDSFNKEPDVEEPTTENPTVKPEGGGSQTGNKPTGGTATVDNLAQALELEGVSLTYKGFKVCSNYPEVDGIPAFVIKAVQGKKLVVLEFDMKNNSGNELNFDIASKDLYVKGIFNNSIKTNALVTLLPEALNTYKDNIPAGGTVSAVLVFEMSDGYVNNLSQVTVEVKSESGTKTVKVQ